MNCSDLRIEKAFAAYIESLDSGISTIELTFDLTTEEQKELDELIQIDVSLNKHLFPTVLTDEIITNFQDLVVHLVSQEYQQVSEKNYIDDDFHLCFPSSEYHSIGDWINIRRRSLGLTLDNLSQILGISKLDVADLESGKMNILSTSVNMINCLADALNVGVEELKKHFIQQTGTNQMDLLQGYARQTENSDSAIEEIKRLFDENKEK